MVTRQGQGSVAHLLLRTGQPASAVFIFSTFTATGNQKSCVEKLVKHMNGHGSAHVVTRVRAAEREREVGQQDTHEGERGRLETGGCELFCAKEERRGLQGGRL